MQTWARRGIQTALVTGGLLMLGTGIASAHENVSPDRPASPIDGGVSVPVHVGNNALGTPFGQKDLPGVDRTVSTHEVTDAVTGALPQGAGLPTNGVASTAGKLPVALSKAAPSATKVAPGLAKALPAGGNLPNISNVTSGNLPVVGSATSGVTSKVSDLTNSVPAASSLPAVPGTDSTQALGGDPLLGNRGRVDVVVPVDVSGNAIAAGGPAAVQNNSDQNVSDPDPVITGFDPGALTNNVVAVNYALPVQIANNAVGAAGNATSNGSANQSATTGGDIVTNGSRRTLSGNVAEGQLATPVQVAGNAVAGAGQAASVSDNSTAGHSNGSILTDGSVGSGSGNVAGVPVALPVEVDGQAIGAGGNAGADSTNTANTTAGCADLVNAPRGAGALSSTMPAYAQTSGFNGVLSGNGAVPAVANPVEVAGNAVAGAANTGTSGMTTNTDSAGGYTTTNGQAAAGSGNLAGVPVADPVHVFGNGASIAGTANGIQANSENATAGGTSYANGIGGVLTGNDASTPVAGSTDVFGSGGSLGGNASGTGANDVMTTTGGYTGTSGSGATGGGNIAQVPVGIPAEVFGAAASLGGNAGGTVPAESKTITAGGNSNTDDDYGVLSSNVAQAPTSAAAQVFGDAAGLVANDNSSADSRTSVTTGGNATGTGRQGTGSGNIVSVPTALPAQVTHNAANLVGLGSAIGSNNTTLGAGGDDNADGSGGSVSGNVVSVPNSGPVQVIGNAVAGGANDAALADNQTTTWAGGDTTTDGTAGSISGNAVGAQVIHTAQVFGNAAAAAGNALGHASSETATAAGGSTTSHGDWGAVSGDLVNVPATAIAQVFANGVAGAGNADALGANQLASVDGGPTGTTGNGSLSGLDGAVPAGVVAQVYQVPVQVLGRALVAGANDSHVVSGEQAPAVDVPLSLQNAPTVPQFGLPTGTDALLPIDRMPNLATLPLSFPHLAGSLPGLSSLPRVPGMPSTQDLPVAGLPGIPAGLGNLPGGTSVLTPLPSVPFLPALPTALPTGLPTALPTALPTGLPTGLPSTQDMPAGLPSLPTLVAVPTLASVPGLPALPGADVPNLSDLPGLPGTAGLPDVSNFSSVPSLPSLPDVPGTSNLPGVDSVPTELSGFSGDLPLAGQLPTTPSTQSLPEVPLATPSTLPFTGSLPTLPVDGLPIGQGDPALPVGLPEVPQVGTLPTVSSSLLPGNDDLLPNQDVDTQSAPALPMIGDELPGLAGLPVFSAPLAATSLPTLGALPSIGADGLLPSLPTGLPTSSLGDGTNLPSLGQLSNPASTQAVPTFGTLPALPTLPAALTLPGMPALPSTPHLPTTQSFAVTPGLSGSDLDLPNFENAVPAPSDFMVGGAPVSSVADLTSSPLTGVQAPGALSSVDAPALSASDSAASALRNLAGQGLDGVQLPSA
jgi:hypothetical protein